MCARIACVCVLHVCVYCMCVLHVCIACVCIGCVSVHVSQSRLHVRVYCKCVRIACVRERVRNDDSKQVQCVNIRYGVALVSRIDKIIGLFRKRTLQKRLYSAKETYNLIDPLTVATAYTNLVKVKWIESTRFDPF